MTASSAGPTIVPTIRYTDGRAAIEFLRAAFGFATGPVTEGEDGAVVHAELTYADGVVMVASRSGTDSPFDTGRVCTYLVTETPDALHDQALAAGAEIVMGLVDQDYGSREFAARDPEGNVWCFGTYRPAPSA
ncbi:MAG: VOC family protein [Geodermatophilaceae bacterium]|nr:VOC family protein [Geodermatophilaceae bacterium]